MLQTTLYHVDEYLRWFHRTRDFNLVAKRRALEFTIKAKMLLLGAAFITLALIALALVAVVSGINSDSWPVLGLGIVIVVMLPWLVAYSLALVVQIGKTLIQKPREKRINANTKRKLSKHKAIKIAIAGSYGKTTMREILKNVLGESKLVAAPPHTYNTPLGVAKFVDTLNGREEVLIFELGEHYPGDIKQLCEIIDPDIGIITGVNTAHLERFGEISRTIATVFELADYLATKPVYVNKDSELAAQNARQGNILYGKDGVGNWEVKSASTDLSGTYFVADRGKTNLHVESKLLGLHQVGPLCLAVAVASRLGLRPQRIKAGLAKTESFEHRLQPLTWPGGVTILDDSFNGSPDGFAAAIKFLKSLKAKRKIYVTPGMVELGSATAAAHVKVGEEVGKGVDVVVLIENSVTEFIKQGLKKAGFKGQLLKYPDMPTALKALPSLCLPGDVVLLANDWSDNYA